MSRQKRKSVLSILKENLKKHKDNKQSSENLPTLNTYIQLQNDKLYRLRNGENSSQGIDTLRVDFSRDVVINSKTKDSYLMWLRWLKALPETEIKKLSTGR